MDGEHQKRMCFREDRSALVECKNITQEIQVLGDILISLCSSLLNGKAEKKEYITVKAVFQYLEVISRTENCSFATEELNMQKTFCTIFIGTDIQLCF